MTGPRPPQLSDITDDVVEARLLLKRFGLEVGRHYDVELLLPADQPAGRTRHAGELMAVAGCLPHPVSITLAGPGLSRLLIPWHAIAVITYSRNQHPTNT